MAGIYNADIYCDSCIKEIKREIAYYIIIGKKTAMNQFITTEATIDDIVTTLDQVSESDYDSDEYPKWADDEAESDSPTHCGNREACLEAEQLENNVTIGKLIGTSLTTDGEEYVKNEVKSNSDNEVVKFWKQEFSYIDYEEDQDDEEAEYIKYDESLENYFGDNF